MTPERIVLDTNTIVSRLLAPRSTPGVAVDHAINYGQVLASDATLLELADVLSRAKFDPYVTVRERQEFFRLFERIVERVEVIRIIRACRDPKDDKFLELAVAGMADVIVTGDADLLILTPFQGIPILKPAEFIKR